MFLHDAYLGILLSPSLQILLGTNISVKFSHSQSSKPCTDSVYVLCNMAHIFTKTQPFLFKRRVVCVCTVMPQARRYEIESSYSSYWYIFLATTTVLYLIRFQIQDPTWETKKSVIYGTYNDTWY